VQTHRIQTTCITDSAVFAMMARANMVVVGAHAVLANGGMLGVVRFALSRFVSQVCLFHASLLTAALFHPAFCAQCGLHLVALAASRHAVPFVVLTGLHKLSPLFPHDPDVTLNDLKSPAQLLDFDAIADSLPADGQGVGPDLHVPNPFLDYVPPPLISLFITDAGCHCPSYVYRLLTEYYSPEDMNLAPCKAALAGAAAGK
jgi:translation initiation factor eIF-2B subunit beta